MIYNISHILNSADNLKVHSKEFFYFISGNIVLDVPMF